MIVILEHEYQKDDPKNEQKRYVVVDNWDLYKDCLLGIKLCYPVISMPQRTLSNNLYMIASEEYNKSLVIEYMYKDLTATFIHEATVVKKRSFFDESVVVVNTEEDKYDCQTTNK